MSDYRPDVVVGKYDPSLFQADGLQLLVNEVFYSLQGEGLHAGEAAVFIRLAKCHLACKFCDTEFETFQKQNIYNVADRVSSLVWQQMNSESTSKELPFVVLTGGEPALQNCGPLIEELRMRGFSVHIETSGSVWADWMTKLQHICVSPKVPYGRIPDQLKLHAREFKWVLNGAFLSMYDRGASTVYHIGTPNFLQPESNNPKWIAAATKLIQRHPKLYRMSLQQHKLMGLP